MAARQMGITQPPLSIQIAALERELGVVLLDRAKSPVELTEIGRTFAEYARRVVRAAGEATEGVRRAQQGKIGKLTVSFSTDAAFELLPRVLKLYRACYPDVSLQLQERSTGEQVRMLTRGEANVGFLHPPIDVEGLVHETIWIEPLALVMPDRHPLAGIGSVHLSQLKNESFVRFPRDTSPGTFDRIWRRVDEVGVTPNVVHEATHMTTLISMVAAGLGICILPSAVRALQRSGVAYALIADDLQLELAIAWPASQHSAVLEGFVQTTRAALSENQANNDRHNARPRKAPGHTKRVTSHSSR
jgi:DNA-binding transcriptional LysR family regulator